MAGLLDLLQSNYSTTGANPQLYKNRAGAMVRTDDIFTGAMSALANMLGGAARGSVTSAMGLPGDINQAIVNNVGSLFPNAPALPTTEQWQQLLPGAPTTGEGKIAQTLGQFIPLSPELGKLAGQAINDAMVYGTGPLARITPQPMRVIANEGHPSWDKMLGDAAKMMEEDGKTPEQIYNVTKTYKNPNGEWEQANIDYRGSHKAPSPEFGAPLHDLTGGGQMYPADVYSDKAAQYYGTGYPKADKEAFALARQVKGKPDAEVTMYRAVPKDVKNINEGDWVTLSKSYAENHGESVLGNDYKILSKKVKAKDLWTNADSIHEFGYHPQEE